MEIALSQQNYTLGDYVENGNLIIKDIERAIDANADLVVFSELSITGYPPTDFFNFENCHHQVNEVLERLLPLSEKIGIIVGAPSHNPVPEGKDLYNSAYYLYEGKIQNIINKTLLPTYDIFDEYRYFEINREFQCITHKGKKIALTICEDIWDIEEENPLYIKSPMEELAKENPDLMINISASPFSYGHSEKRKAVVAKNCKKYNIPMYYCTSVGGQTELVFDGGSMVCDTKGSIKKELKYFEEDFAIISTENLSEYKIDIQEDKSKIARKHEAIVLGIRDYFSKLNLKTAILGLSGGIDSALTLALAAEALGPENVHSILMPSHYSSQHSVDDAVQICKNLGSPYKVIRIEKNYNAMIETLSEAFEGKDEDVTEENIQSRLRGLILMANSNKFGHILLNTSNKSELAVGYGTLYGDMCGGLSVIGDLYKTQVYDMSRYINRNREIIPINTIDKPPSAELKPDQVDQDTLPPYDILDAILRHYINHEMDKTQIIKQGYDEKLVNRILWMVDKNEFKRFQTPPIIRVSSKAFGFGRRIPIVAKF